MMNKFDFIYKRLTVIEDKIDKLAREIKMIPKTFIDEYLQKKDKIVTFLGVPLEKLSRDELMACAICGWEEAKSARKESAKERDFLLSLMKR